MKSITAVFFAAAVFSAGCSRAILKKDIPDKLVVLTFDDAPVTHYTTAAPVLKKYNFGATFYVCEFPPNFNDKTKYMSWQQIQGLSKMGFEIGNHTHHHALVGKLSEEKFAGELKYAEDTCKALNIPEITTFAYPSYNLSLTNFITLKEKGYQFARAGGSRVYDPLKDHPYLIPSWALKDSNKDQIMAALKLARDGKITVLTIHGIPDYEHPWVTTAPKLFAEICEYLYSNQYKVISIKDLRDYVNAANARKLIKPDFSKPLH
ncbi:MAG: polysaccharide deacetylase family protein [Daejeonella sp.]